MSSILDILSSLWSSFLATFKNEEEDVVTFFVAAAQYAAQNIKPAIVKAAGDAMVAAEQSFSTDNTVDKYTFAFSNIVAVLEKDGVAFIESDINYAIEAVVQHRNARAATTAA